MSFIKEFSQLGKGDASIAGGKGASLGEMMGAGIPVPSGFVILSDAFERFLDETQLHAEIESALHSVNQEEMHTVENASAKIQALILTAKMPEDIGASIQEFYTGLDAQFVAVRSSATAEDSASAAWAGQLDSFLNTTEETLLANVQHCWASLFTPRAIFYRYEKELHKTKISVAVVVQKMVQSEVSGIAFSVHPVTEDYNQLIIEGGFGLGEAIVSGQVTPDSYVIEKEPRRIIDKNITFQSRALWRAENGGNEWRSLSEKEGTKPALSDDQALELAEIVLRIESHYGFPCDIEWAYEAGKFFITQSRPITTLAQISNATQFESPLLIDFKPNEYRFFGHWKQRVFATCTWVSCWNEAILHEIGLETKELTALHLKDGNFFLKKSEVENIHTQIAQKIDTGDEAFFRNMAEVARRVFTTSETYSSSNAFNEVPTPETFEKFLKIARDVTLLWLYGAEYAIDVTEEKLRERVVAESFPADQVPQLIPEIATPHTFLREDILKLKKEVGGKSLKEVCSDPVLLQIFEAYVLKYAWIEVHSFVGEPLSIERLYEQVTHTTVEPSQKPMPETASEELHKRGRIVAYCGYVKNGGAEHFDMLSGRARPFLHAICKKIGITYDELLYLTDVEVLHALRGDITTKEIKDRSDRRQEMNVAVFSDKNNQMVFIENSRDVAILEREMIPVNESNTSIIHGDVGNPGKYTGVVRIVMNNDNFLKFQTGEVLVSTMTTPNFLILMQKSGAIVTDIGGVLCHAAIVSREMGKPCVIGTKFATNLLKDGDLVEVDADRGVVRILERISSTVESTLVEKFPYIKEKDGYVVQGQWIIPLLAWSFWISWAHAKKAVEFGFKKIGSQYLMVNHHGFREKDGLAQEVQDLVSTELHQGINVAVNKIFSYLEELENQIVAVTEKLEGAPNSLEFLKKALLLHAEGTLPVTLVDSSISAAVEQVIAEEIEKGKFDHTAVYSHIADRKTSSHLDFDRLRSFKTDLIQASCSVNVTIDDVEVKSPGLATTLREYQRETEYLGTHNCAGTGRTMERLLTSIFDAPPAFAVTPTPLDMPATLTTSLAVAELSIYWRTQMGEDFSRMMYAARPALTEFGRQFDMSYDETMHATYEEIVEAIDDVHSFDKDRVLDRIGKKIAMIASPEDGRVQVMSGSFVELLEKQFSILPTTEEDTSTEARGKTAFKGKVRGRVAVVMKSTDGEKVEEGMILVAPETTPDFIFAMNKAAAFITDRGGITSHAAIIAREMRKPCIIGTKNGTRILHDGDLVEVDADRGVVRILERVERNTIRKLIERDATLMMQGLFSLTMIEDMREIHDLAIPYRPMELLYVTDANIQIWESEQGQKWLLDKLLERNQRSTAFMESVTKDYKPILAEIQKYWDKGALTDRDELREYFALMRKAISYIAICFYVGIDERTPKAVQEIAIKIRETDELFAHGDEFARDCFAAFGRNRDLGYLVLSEEFMGTLPTDEELERRAKGAVLVDGKEFIVSSLEAFTKTHTDYDLRGTETANTTQKEARGKSAFKGKVSGVVRIVKNRKQAALVEAGDIIVSPMTTPDFIDAMKKAAAFVTDEGGITCHAAIVAREMKKPCIIGTKNATQLFKDGDLVEVDADKGVVRIIERV